MCVCVCLFVFRRRRRDAVSQSRDKIVSSGVSNSHFCCQPSCRLSFIVNEIPLDIHNTMLPAARSRLVSCRTAQTREWLRNCDEAAEQMRISSSMRVKKRIHIAAVVITAMNSHRRRHHHCCSATDYEKFTTGTGLQAPEPSRGAQKSPLHRFLNTREDGNESLGGNTYTGAVETVI